MKMRKLYHAPCRESGMGFLVPDIENSLDALAKFQCLHCGKNNIGLHDDDAEVIDVKPGDTRLFYIKNAETDEHLLVDGKYLVVFENEEQTKKFADMYGITRYEIGSDQYIYGDKTNGHYLTEEGDEENGKQSSEEEK